MKYFSIGELTASATAERLKISNSPGKTERANLKALVENMLDPIRAYYGKAVKVTSGYRCKALNAAVGGASSSSHMYGLAADIKPADGNMRVMQAKVLEWAKTHTFDQVIIEQPDASGVASWLHVGWKRGSNGAQRRQILKARKVSGRWVYSIYNG